MSVLHSIEAKYNEADAALDKNDLRKAEELLRELPEHADPCGERGEFHTFVHDGPIFERPVAVRSAGKSTDGRFTWMALSHDGGNLTEMPR